MDSRFRGNDGIVVSACVNENAGKPQGQSAVSSNAEEPALTRDFGKTASTFTQLQLTVAPLALVQLAVCVMPCPCP
jgi:hypothetical protein